MRGGSLDERQNSYYFLVRFIADTFSQTARLRRCRAEAARRHADLAAKDRCQMALIGEARLLRNQRERFLRIDRKGRIETFDTARRRSADGCRAGPDGAVWLIEFWANSIGRWRGGKFAEFDIGRPASAPSGLALGPTAAFGSACCALCEPGAAARRGDPKHLAAAQGCAPVRRHHRCLRQRLVCRHPRLCRHAAGSFRARVNEDTPRYTGNAAIREAAFAVSTTPIPRMSRVVAICSRMAQMLLSQSSTR
jgi:hypothetical protein